MSKPYKSKTHKLKIWPEPFAQVCDGLKRFEFRKNDRDFQQMDFLLLQEWDPKTEKYTGLEATYLVLYIMKEGFGLPEGYCIMSLSNG
jgi:hypothetical protein